MIQKKYETEAIVLDYLPGGHITDNTPSYRRVPIAQILGVNFFSLLEVVPKTELSPHESIFIGKGDRDKVSHVKSRISYDDLTSYAKSEIEFILREIIKQNEKRFVDFFNTARPLSIRYHQLELLPGVGKKLMKEILAERQKKTFESFEEIQDRVASIPDPANMIMKRIISELKNEDRYRIFANPIIR
ncbi:MAG: DUF655 domain-containing protein [Candidatus Methanofastidiosia archaeon]